jgi:hypothetical protein
MTSQSITNAAFSNSHTAPGDSNEPLDNGAISDLNELFKTQDKPKLTRETALSYGVVEIAHGMYSPAKPTEWFDGKSLIESQKDLLEFMEKHYDNSKPVEEMKEELRQEIALLEAAQTPAVKTDSGILAKFSNLISIVRKIFS